MTGCQSHWLDAMIGMSRWKERSSRDYGEERAERGGEGGGGAVPVGVPLGLIEAVAVELVVECEVPGAWDAGGEEGADS